jgi:hypothetical protein
MNIWNNDFKFNEHLGRSYDLYHLIDEQTSGHIIDIFG